MLLAGLACDRDGALGVAVSLAQAAQAELAPAQPAESFEVPGQLVGGHRVHQLGRLGRVRQRAGHVAESVEGQRQRSEAGGAIAGGSLPGLQAGARPVAHARPVGLEVAAGGQREPQHRGVSPIGILEAFQRFSRQRLRLVMSALQVRHQRGSNHGGGAQLLGKLVGLKQPAKRAGAVVQAAGGGQRDPKLQQQQLAARLSSRWRSQRQRSPWRTTRRLRAAGKTGSNTRHHRVASRSKSHASPASIPVPTMAMMPAMATVMGIPMMTNPSTRLHSPWTMSSTSQTVISRTRSPKRMSTRALRCPRRRRALDSTSPQEAAANCRRAPTAMSAFV